MPPEKREGYLIEIFINEVITEGRMPITARVMRGVTHRTKRIKFGRIEHLGYRRSWRMLRDLWKLWGVCRKRTYWFFLRDVTFESAVSPAPRRGCNLRQPLHWARLGP